MDIISTSKPLVTTSENENNSWARLLHPEDKSAMHDVSSKTLNSRAPDPQGTLPQSSSENSQGAISTIATLEPASNGDQRKFTSNQGQNRTRQRRLRQAMLTHDNGNSQNLPNYPKYFSIKFVGIDLDKVNPIAIERSLLEKAGNFAANVRRQNRNTLLVQANNQQQANKLPEIKEIASHGVIITAHSTLNQSKGTVYSETLSACTIAELEEALRDQNATKVERMKRRENGELVETHRHIITFNKSEPPRTIRITDWHYELVDLYIPTPMQCTKCQKLGHTQKYCRREGHVCARCAQEGHQARECQNNPKCTNCDGDHKSIDKKCPHYEYKCEVLATQTRQRCTYHEAEDIVQDRFRAQGKRYNFVVRRQRPQQPSQETPPNVNNEMETIQPPLAQEPTAQTEKDESKDNPCRETTQEAILLPDQPSTSALPTTTPTPKPSVIETAGNPQNAVKPKTKKDNAAANPSDGTKVKTAKQGKKEKKNVNRRPSMVDYSSDSSQQSSEENLSAAEADGSKQASDEWNTTKGRPPRQPKLPQTSTGTSVKNRYQLLDNDNETDASDTMRNKRKLSPSDDSTFKKPAKETQKNPIPPKKGQKNLSVQMETVTSVTTNEPVPITPAATKELQNPAAAKAPEIKPKDASTVAQKQQQNDPKETVPKLSNRKPPTAIPPRNTDAASAQQSRQLPRSNRGGRSSSNTSGKGSQDNYWK